MKTKKRKALLQDNLYHLHEGCNHKDEGNRLKVLEIYLQTKQQE